MYVDKTLGDVPASERVTVAQKKPVQLLFEFQTNGSANARATKYLTKQVTDSVTASGLFSSVSTTPAEGGAILSVTINNIPQKDAAGKGFVTGLTLGAAGTQVSDYYAASVKYVGGATAAPLTKEAKHAIHTLIGAKEDPANAIPVKNADEGITMVTRQLIDRMLTDLAKDPAFAGAKVAFASPMGAPYSVLVLTN